MTPQDMAKVLRGDRDGKVRLFDEFMSRIQAGETLADDELPILEALKKELIKPVSQIVQLEANLVGSSTAKG